MSLADFSHEELKQKSMIVLASIILKDAKKALSFQEIFDQISEIKGFTEAEKEDKIAQFYTEMNVDGRFMTIGSNMWGLKEWYPVDQADEEVAPAPKKRKKKKSEEDEDEDEDLEYDDGLVELGEEEDEDEDVEDLESFDELYDEDDIDAPDEEELDIEIDEDEEEEKL